MKIRVQPIPFNEWKPEWWNFPMEVNMNTPFYRYVEEPDVPYNSTLIEVSPDSSLLLEATKLYNVVSWTVVYYGSIYYIIVDEKLINKIQEYERTNRTNNQSEAGPTRSVDGWVSSTKYDSNL